MEDVYVHQIQRQAKMDFNVYPICHPSNQVMNQNVILKMIVTKFVYLQNVMVANVYVWLECFGEFLLLESLDAYKLAVPKQVANVQSLIGHAKGKPFLLVNFP